MGFSYGYNRAETLADYRTGRESLLMLLDLVSRGGNLLLISALPATAAFQ